MILIDEATLQLADIDSLIEAKKMVDVEIKSRAMDELKSLKARQAMLEAMVGGGNGNYGAEVEKTPAAPKYRHPDDPEKTWTGRGKRPNWLSGVEDLEPYRIP